jgi:hypothetical protein
MPNMQGPLFQHQGTDGSKCRQPTQNLSLARFARLAAQGDRADQLGRQMHNAVLRLARFRAIIS